MKKFLTIGLCLLFVLSLASCKKEPEVINEEPDLLGGWQAASDETITPELQEIFNSAMEGYVGMGFSPIKLLATQVVAGTNYKFLCDATLVSPTPEKSKKIVIIFEDLNGDAKITDVIDYEE